jgi:uncharacterized protein YlxP (DUF503 family)
VAKLVRQVFPMFVAVARLVLAIPESHSLKTKRKVVRRVLDRVRHRFNVAAAEVEAMDVHQRAVLGLSVVSNDGRHAQSQLDKIVGQVGVEARIVERRSELIPMGDMPLAAPSMPELAEDEDMAFSPEDFRRGRGE